MASDVIRKTILLIGTTGSGKSALGNFLIDPSKKPRGTLQPFPTATDNNPKTDHVAKKLLHLDDSSNATIEIVDTPGINESAYQDLSHMIEVINMLHESKVVSACILCVKFNAKIDAQYRSTIEYYRKLLPNLFRNENVMLVFTAYSENEHETAKREEEGIEVDKVIDNALSIVSKLGGLKHRVQYFVIDSKPYTDEDRSISGKHRSAILQRILSTKPVNTESLVIAKIPRLIDLHKQRAEKLEGEIQGYNERLRKLNRRADRALQDTEKNKRRITQLDAEIEDITKKIEDMNTKELIETHRWQKRMQWKFGVHSEEFDLQSQSFIHDYNTWDNGHMSWSDITRSDYAVKGKVCGEYFRGLYCQITLKSMKREVFAAEIRDLKSEKRSAQENKNTLLSKVSHHKAGEFQKEINTLLGFIKKREKEQKFCRKKTMDIEEAKKCLSELAQPA